MNRVGIMVAGAAWALLPSFSVTTAAADDAAVPHVVTYEVVSPVVRAANIEYVTATGRTSVPNASLPWRFTVPVQGALGPPPDGSQVRADWRSAAGPARWVSVRVYYNGELICQNTLDVGNAACYGSTRRIT
jgi:Mycobacterium membrane protein